MRVVIIFDFHISLKFTKHQHRPNGHDMNVEKAWEQDIIGRGGVVSILDDGLEYTHPDLKDNYVSIGLITNVNIPEIHV